MSDTPSAPSAPPAFTMPVVTEHHSRLERLAGTWRGEERLFPSPWLPGGGTAEAKVEARMALDIENSRDGGATWSTFMEGRYRRTA